MKDGILIRQADSILTMDDERRELTGYDIRISEGQITEIGQNLVSIGEKNVINAHGCLITPGLVNTHHHLFQTLNYHLEILFFLYNF